MFIAKKKLPKNDKYQITWESISLLLLIEFGEKKN